MSQESGLVALVVATWNVQWATPRSERAPHLLNRLNRHAPDAICLTETHHDLLLPDGAHIERHVPALPLSQDASHLQGLKRSLAVYRMVSGQPRQDDLLAFLLEQYSDEILNEIAPLLRIDLFPRRAKPS